MSDWLFSFGEGPVPEGFRQISPECHYNAINGCGWTQSSNLLARDRQLPDPLRRGFILSFEPGKFRVDTGPGIFRLDFEIGDTLYDNHITELTVNGFVAEKVPPVRTALWEFVSLQFSIELTDPFLEVGFQSPVNNWIINALSIQRAGALEPLHIKRNRIYRNLWALPEQTDRGCRALFNRWRLHPASSVFVPATGVTRESYLRTAGDVARFFALHQDVNGAIIDPYRQQEFQYATPCFAYVAALVGTQRGCADLTHRAALAFDWASTTLAARKAANDHEDFFPSPLAHAYKILSEVVDSERLSKWKTTLSGFDPFEIYRVRAGGHDGPGSNWNCKAAAGEYLLYRLGLRPNADYAEFSLKEQGRFFNNEYGMYAEGPMVYDAFPRAWLSDMIATAGRADWMEELEEALNRGALTGLLMQSPLGELPIGGRSSQHQWADVLQTLIFEIQAARAFRSGDLQLAGVFKRSARRAYLAVLPWQRPSGEFWIVKNRLDPSTAHGYESYSSHSQYNLLLATALGYSFEHALATENLAERKTPAESGGVVLRLDQPFSKIIANAAGTQVTVITDRDPRQTPVGLVRIHFLGAPSALGPSDGMLADTMYLLPSGQRPNASIGLAWHTNDGHARSLADIPKGKLDADFAGLSQDSSCVSFRVRYHPKSEVGILDISETFELSYRQVHVRYS